MHFLFQLLIFGLVCTCVRAQNIEVVAIERDKGIDVQVTNQEYAPVSVTFTYEVKNLDAERGLGDTIVLPPRSKKVVHRLRQRNADLDYSYSYKYRYAFGDHRKGKPDMSHVYELPYATGKSYPVIQGYNGKYSHRGRAQLDFGMPVGTPVHAARAGVVTQIMVDHDRNCDQPKCKQYNNYIVIMHEDGTFAEYVHLQHDGAVVEKGQPVMAGEHIGYSGNSGYSNTPHLHFCVYQPKFQSRKFVPTYFSAEGPDSRVVLQEGQSYLRRAK
jgi:murein DD-endopeptidase MepM/ murein hydrolase activator NlpD